MKARRTRPTGREFAALVFLAGLTAVPCVVLGVERLSFKPWWGNRFTPEQDVAFGRQGAADAEKQFPLLKDAQTEQYISALGHRLVLFAPNNSPAYVWQFKVVNSSDINAFALPGGFVYVNRGAIEAAQDEAQIAGVMAHESGHVVMRHGTTRATKAMLAELAGGLLEGIAGQSGSLTSQVFATIGGFGIGSWMLHNSRQDETQADEVGTYILYHGGYDPHAMAQFFDIIQKKYPQRTIQFFSDHPVPENRIKDVNAEIPLLGPATQGKTNTPEFDAMKKHLLGLPPAPKAQSGGSAPPKPASPPPPPSSRLQRYEGEGFTIRYPDNWQAEKTGDGIALFPAGGMISDEGGDVSQAYGASITNFRPTGQAGWGLVEATQELFDSWRGSNPNLHVLKQTGAKVLGQPALVTLLENDSPLGGQKENDQVLTLRRSDSLLALVFVAPQSSFDAYKPTFDAMEQSLEIR